MLSTIKGKFSQLPLFGPRNTQKCKGTEIGINVNNQLLMREMKEDGNYW